MNKLSKLYRWFKNPKTTLYILLALVILYFSGLFIPQKVFFNSKAEYDVWIAVSPWLHKTFDFLGFTEIYVSPITFFFLTLFFLNLLIVTLERTPLILKKAYLIGDAKPNFDASTIKRLSKVKTIEVSSSEGKVEAIVGYFKNRGWFVAVNGETGALMAVKNRLSILGFLMFHLSFFVLLIGSILIFYSRFSGNVTLTEGQWFEGDIKQFHRVHRQPKMLFELPALQFYLNRVTMIYEEGQPSDLKVSLKSRYEEKESEHTIRVNKPIRFGSLSLLCNNAGVSPLMILRDAKSGKELDGIWVSLNVLRGQEDSFFFERDPETIYHANFFPDYVIEEGMEKSASPEIKNPAFYISVRKNNIPIASATIKMGQAMIFKDMMLEFRDLRHWAEFQMIREFGPAPIIVGFSLAIAGLILRLIFYRREIRVAVEGPTVYLVGTTQLYEFSFGEEVEGIIVDIKQSL